MKKHIDSEKLIAKIERRKNESREIAKEHKNSSLGNAAQTMVNEDEEILSLIASLQQEPRFPQYDNIVEKVFGAGNLEGWERDEAEMLVALAKEELLKSLQEEQPEVDLEKITKYSRIKELPDGFEKEWLCYYHKNPEYNSAKFFHLSLTEREYIIARHFWDKGYNARKEE